jgi:DNA excision repair protein ERCC-4
MAAGDIGPEIEIVVDDREAQSRVAEYLAQLQFRVRWERLSLGDYWVPNCCLFERKTITDFAASIIDGRLFEQASRLAAHPGRVALIVEGRAPELAQLGIRREAMQGALISLSLVFGLPVLRALDAEETARLILYSSRQLLVHPGRPFYRPGRKPKNKRKLQLRILQCLPGVGGDRAEDLLDVFGSVDAVMRASAEELQAVKGIGEKTASGICWVLRECPTLWESTQGSNW